MVNPCPFCELDAKRIVLADDLVVALRDGFPISPGHSLILPKRHISSFFDARGDEQKAIIDMMCRIKELVDAEFQPDGYNIGINDGEAAGQTVGHLHLHLIPRYQGDRADPRGGIRWIIPEKADYWTGRTR